MKGVGKIQTKLAACIIAYPQAEVGNLVFINSG